MSGIYTFFLDESNTSPHDGEFFIYGGLAMSAEAAIAAHNLVIEIRRQYGFQPRDQFKFQTKSRPESMTIENWTKAKTDLVSRAAKIDELDLLTYVILHNIADKQNLAEYGLNVLISHFDMRYLSFKSAHGTVSIDRLDAKFGFNYLRKRFNESFNLPDGRSVDLTRTLLLNQTCDGASHLSSLVDIVLGGFRYCVNTATGKGTEAVANELFPPLADMMWGWPEGDTKRIGGYGYLKYPKTVKVPSYQEKYDHLADALAKYGASAEEASDATDGNVS